MAKTRTVPLRNGRVAATLLWIPADTMKWMDTQCLQIAVNTGAKLGRVTIARAILNGLSKAGLSLAACRSECEVEDVARALATPALEVKG